MAQEQRKFDIAVIGSGPGGYPAAIRAAQNGKSVALIEAKDIGGTCLNRGCIPSKVLIANAEVFSKILQASVFGIQVGEVTFDYAQMAARKDDVVTKKRKGLEGLLAANKIQILRGTGKFISPHEIKVIGQDNEVIWADKVIIATGSEPRNIPAFPCDNVKILDSTGILALKKVPKSLVIIGGGVIGCEFASLYATLGVKVTVLEMLPRILPMEAEIVSKELSRAFNKKGITVSTGVKVQAIDQTPSGVIVKMADGQTVEAELALVAVGRSLNTRDIGLEKVGVKVGDDGIIPVNEKMETVVPGIYAIGDIASKYWLAHVATMQGVIAASNASGHAAKMRYNAIPSVTFTKPEVATVGLSLEDALAKGYQAITGAFPFQALGKTHAEHETEGFAQIVLDRKTGQILGAQVVGYEASALIAEIAVAIANELTVESIADTIHAHPTMPEAWMQAALVAQGLPIDIPPKSNK